MANFDPVEIRILGSLVEKQRTTPEGYPLSLNALRAACNQSTNRDPVVDYDEPTLRRALNSLAGGRWVRSGTGHGGRAVKYRHLIGDHLDIDESRLSLLAVLMLRGLQTPGELKQRVERLSHYEDLGAIHEALAELTSAGLVAALPRRPGQKEERYRHLLGEEVGGEAPEALAWPEGAAEPPEAAEPELAALRRELGEIADRVAALERRLDSP